MATTAYGGKAAVPAANLIVAGTSCKDFSNLKGHDRKSIEAMGTSGETFIGFVDLLFATCIYTSGEAFSIGSWDRNAQTFQRPLVICTASDPVYHVANVALLMLPFCTRLLQCVRQIYDARREGSEGWRQPLAWRDC